ncbi:MAG: hypothetical protein GXX00_00425 [Hungateiclostridium thermocellum]|nr:hypothetical protein [Acetivibrio thermocellus]
MKVVKYMVKINLMTPFNISSRQERRGSVQRRTVLCKNRPYIPGSTIKGKIRDNFYKITDLNHTENDCNCVMCTIFGGQGYKPSKIYVDDFLPVESESTENKDLAVRYGIAINRYSKTNKDNRLYSQEVATGGKFCGNITVYFDDETIRYKRNIEMAMKMVNSIGGGHSKGFGRAEVQWEEV